MKHGGYYRIMKPLVDHVVGYCTAHQVWQVCWFLVIQFSWVFYISTNFQTKMLIRCFTHSSLVITHMWKILYFRPHQSGRKNVFKKMFDGIFDHGCTTNENVTIQSGGIILFQEEQFYIRLYFLFIILYISFFV